MQRAAQMHILIRVGTGGPFSRAVKQEIACMHCDAVFSGGKLCKPEMDCCLRAWSSAGTLRHADNRRAQSSMLTWEHSRVGVESGMLIHPAGHFVPLSPPLACCDHRPSMFRPHAEHKICAPLQWHSGWVVCQKPVARATGHVERTCTSPEMCCAALRCAQCVHRTQGALMMLSEHHPAHTATPSRSQLCTGWYRK